MNLLRREPPAVEFISRTPKLTDMWPPVPAGRALPDWWRAQPPFLKERKYFNLRVRQDATIKSCPGISDYMGLGYVLPMWCDYIFTATEDGFRWETSAPTDVVVFQPEVWDHFPRPEGTHAWMLKVTAPWYIRTPKGYSVMLMGPWYHRSPYWSVFPGVMDSDRCPVLNFICMWHAPVGEAVLIKAGTPLFHAVPFRRDKLVLDIKADQDEFDAMTGSGVGAVNGWTRLAYGAYRENKTISERK